MNSATPIRQYFSRHRYDKVPTFSLPTPRKLPTTPIAYLWPFLAVFAPASYAYILLVLLRELFGAQLVAFGQAYWPLLSKWTLASAMFPPLADESHATTTSRLWLWFWMEVWCYTEAVFYIWMRCRIRYFESQDPLQASLEAAAPLATTDQRSQLWRRMMDCEVDDVTTFVQGWFFDESVDAISAYDIRDFVAWSMFEGRHQEHLTAQEVRQMEDFCQELQYRISLELYGVKEEDEDDDEEEEAENGKESKEDLPAWQLELGHPKQGECTV